MNLNFYKDLTRKDGLLFIATPVLINIITIVKSKEIFMKKKRKIGFSFKLAHNIRVRSRQAFKSQNVEKLNKTFDLIGCSQSFLRKWILYQLRGNMTQENYCSVWTIDHCYPLS